MDESTTLSEESWVTNNNSLAPNTTHSNNNGSSDMSNINLTIMYVDFWLVVVTISSIDCLGILGNLYSIVVWHTDKAFNATQFLFKYLAVWDLVFLGLDLAYNNILRFKAMQLLSIYHINNFVQLVSVHVTLLITVSRWIAVTFPLHASRLLPCRRIYLSCVLLLFYCAILEATQLVYNWFYSHHIITIFVIKVVVGLVLPLLLLLIFNLSLLWNAFRRPGELQTIERNSASQNKASTTCCRSLQSSNTAPVSLEQNGLATTTLSSGGQNDSEPNTGEETKQKPPGKHKHKQEQQQQRQNTNTKIQVCHQTQSQRSPKQKMVKAVLLVSVFSFIAYPVGVSTRIYVIDRHEVPQLTRHILTYVAHVFQGINSSINVLIYWFFVSKFRQLAKDLRRRLSVRCGCAGGREVTSH